MYIILLTLALYCYSSTAVQLAVQFFCWLRTLLWRQGSYMSWKLSSYNHVKPFLRYLWSKGRLSEPSGKGHSVDPRTDHPDQKSFFFLNPFFLPFVFFFVTLHFAFSVTFTSLSFLRVPRYLHSPNFRDVSPISPPTFLHLLCLHFWIPPLPNLATNPWHLSLCLLF